MNKKTTSLLNFTIACFLCLILFIPRQSEASHAMGADITYTCLGNNQYEVTFSFYRDCFGILPSNQMQLNITSTCFPNTPSVFLNLVSGWPVEISPACSTVTTTCNGGSYTGIQEWKYTGIITLPGPCADWTISHTESARNAAINTISNPGGNNLHVFSTINNTNGICNNSPTFSNRPVPFTCVDQTFTFNHGAVDADGDSLVYQLINPLAGAGQPVTYLPGFSFGQPVISSPPVLFNGTTGDIRMTPTQPNVTVFAVLVSEYRNGVLIGQVERDIQLTVEACQNMVPILFGINGTPSYNTTICAETPLCFNIASRDTNVNNTTSITWNGAITGATFNTTGGYRDSATFCWTPTFSDVSTTPHCFTATVRDDNCPYRASQIFTYCITVKGVRANAGPDQVIACNAITDLIGSATLGNGTYTYTWNPNGVNDDTIRNVGIGTYTLTVTSVGCTNTDTVRVLPGIGGTVGAFTSAASCQNRDVQFTDLSNPIGTTITSWSWNFGDGNTSNLQSPSHTYGGNGTYNVVLIIATASGCTDTVLQQVVVNQNIPTAAFSSVNVCQGPAVNFLDQSSGIGLSSWAWNFNDPASGSNTSAAQHPSHLFSQPGNFSINLVVTNTSGCQDQIAQNVTVYPNPVVAVSGAQICEGEQTTLSAPAGYPTYVWSNGGGASTITISPVVTTSYTVTVTDANTCTGSTSASVTVNAIPIAQAGNAQTICEGNPATLSGTGGNTYVWNPGNLVGQNVIVSPVNSTTYTVTATSAAGCSASASVLITINPLPQVNAGDDVQICKGSAATLSVMSGVGNYNWTPGNFNTSSIVVSPVVTTTYILNISDAIGCSGIDSVKVIVNPIPVASFNQSGPVCLSNAINFIDNTTIASGSVNQWDWQFGDGQTSTLQNPDNTYGLDGNYSVKLIVRSNAGCIDSISSQVTVNPNPIANAGLPQQICPGDVATLNGSGGVNYSWSPGGFNTANVQVSPAVTTNYLLTVTDANGCQNSNQVTVTVDPGVVANAGSDVAVCSGEGVSLLASGGTLFLWSPGNVNTASNNFVPVNSGTYSVLVTNTFGCTGIDAVDVIVNPIPVASFNGNQSVCVGNPINLNDISSVSTGTISSWDWNFGNNVSSVQANPTVNYANAGDYQISLTVTSDQGCRASVNLNQTIWANPVAMFINTSVCDGVPVNFINTSTIADGSPLNSTWTLGDGFSTNSPTFDHQFGGSGQYLASLVVTSVNGCVDSTIRQLSVFPLPDAAFTVNPVCEGQPALFQDASLVATGVIASWSWTFGDGSTGAVQNPSHTYGATGDYQIDLFVTTDHGCSDIVPSMIRVIPRPLVDFSTEDVCFGFPVSFGNMSSTVTGTIDQYHWTFGDGGQSDDSDPSYIYSQSGWFPVSLMAVSDSGCITTVTRPNAVHIFTAPVADFTDNAGQASDIYPVVNFYNQTASPGMSYWSFGDSTFSSSFSPVHQYAQIGQYEVQLITIDLNGCVDTTLRTIEVKPTSTIYIPNAFTPNGDLKNDFFQIYSSNMKQMAVQVYDRWGLKIIEWDNPSGGWDGKINGSPAQADVYVYRVVTLDALDKREVRLGHVTLVR